MQRPDKVAEHDQTNIFQTGHSDKDPTEEVHYRQFQECYQELWEDWW